ncbi:MAG TPA: TIGR03067 domain-containing protein, partial [Gemmataceae bacterium]|nr:TIGR03067 domain-containing protein [Gemmataceae bacterium]
FLEEFTKAKLTVKEDKLIFSSEGNRPSEVAYQSDRKPKLDTYWLDPAKKPPTFTMTVSMGGFLSRSIVTVYGIYKSDGNQLTICYSTEWTEKSRPTEFKTKQGSERVLLIYEREKP